MSMNLYVEGTRTATVKVKGKRKTINDRTNFSLWQTPTEVTRQILSLVPVQQAGTTFERVSYLDMVDMMMVPMIGPSHQLILSNMSSMFMNHKI